MKVEDVRSLPDDEIVTAIDKTRQKMFKMKCTAKGTGLENPGLYKSLKTDVARMLTVLRERAAAAAKTS